jgi:hypothetical protein
MMMSATEGFGRSEYAGLLPVPVRATSLENDRVPNGHRSLGKRALRAVAHLLIAFCIILAAISVWRSYGDAARRLIASSYPQLGWLAPRGTMTAEKTPDIVTPTASAAPYPDHRQLDAMLGDLHAMRLSLDRIAAGQELITRSIDEIATRIAAGQEEMTRSTDQTATSIAVGQEPTTRSTNQDAAPVAAGQEQVTRNTDQTATSTDQAPSKTTTRIPGEGRGDPASLQPTVRLNVKPTEAKPTQTLSEKRKPLSAASGHDPSCFPSASAVLQNRPGGWPTWTLRAPGHEGTMCWHAAARPRVSDHRSKGSDHRSETMPSEEPVGTTENKPLPPRGQAEWRGGGPP